MKKHLNKYNTAIDLTKLNGKDYEELCLLTNTWSVGCKYLSYNKIAKKYVHNIYLYRRILLVDFKTFKQIHFQL